MRLLLLLLTLPLLTIACASSQPGLQAKAVEPDAQQAHSGASTTPAVSSQVSADSVLVFSNMETAQQVAQREEKLILLVFAGSDWCRPCIQFENSVLDNDLFKREQKDAYLVVYLDYPARKRNQLPPAQKAYNATWAEKLNPTGQFPRLYLLTASGEVVKELSYTGQDATAFIAQLTAARA